MSGFLCEYQLSVLSNYYVQRKQKVPYGEYCKFLLNRIARLMPLYVLLVLILYYVHTYERNDLKDTSVKCSLPGVVRSLTFTNRMRYKEPALLCAQHGWTIQNDVHGYVSLVVLSAVTQNFGSLGGATLSRYKQALLWTLYAVSVARMLSTKPIDWMFLSKETLAIFRKRARSGIDMIDPFEILVADQKNVGLGSLWESSTTPYDAEIAGYVRNRMFSSYWTGLLGHGSSMFLGGALYLSLSSCRGRPQYLRWKVVSSTLFLFATKAHFSISGLPLYFLLESLLCTDIRSPTAWLRPFLSHPLWKLLSQYSFGYYIVHFLVLYKRSGRTVVERAEAVRSGKPPPFTLQLVVSEVVISFAISLVVAFILYWTVEAPFRSYRKRLLSTMRTTVDTGVDKKKIS